MSDVLQLAPLVEAGERELHRKYRVVLWDHLADRVCWLEENGASIRAVVTGGHLGITNDMIDKLPALELIAVAGVGYEKVDLEKARARGIRVTNTPDILTEDVADLAIGLMISALRRLPASDQHVRTEKWNSGNMPLATKANGRNYGIVGFGRIGQAVARRLEGFGGTIAYTARERRSVPYSYFANVLDLAKASDILFLTVAATLATKNLVGREVLDALGPQGFLVNVARGSIVDESALVAALVEGRLCGAGLDVFVNEPTVPKALFALPSVVLTPHIGSATVEARTAMADIVLANLDAFFSGRPLPTPVASPPRRAPPL